MAQYDSIAKEYDGYFSGNDFKKEDEKLSAMLPTITGDLLDLGCGTGLLIDLLGEKLHAFNYLGVDPSKNMLEILYKKHPSYKTKHCKFESLFTKKRFKYIISTYGSVSYISKRSIKKISKMLTKYYGYYFLMFYSDDYVPVTNGFCGKDIPFNTVSYYKNEIEKYLPNSTYTIFGNYTIVSGVAK